MFKNSLVIIYFMKLFRINEVKDMTVDLRNKLENEKEEKRAQDQNLTIKYAYIHIHIYTFKYLYSNLNSFVKLLICLKIWRNKFRNQRRKTKIQ